MRIIILFALFMMQMLTGGYRKVAVSSLPNFGSSSIGPTNRTTGGFAIGTYFTAPATGTYTTVHLYCSSTAGTTYVGIYPAPSGNASGQTAVAIRTVSCPSTAAWASNSISAPVTSGAQYLLITSSTSSENIWYDSTTGNQGYFSTSSALPTTLGTIINSGTSTLSMYLSKP